jgi:GNAT superfamily N-acetyltransferase
VSAKQPRSGQMPGRLVVRPAGDSDVCPLVFFFDTMLRQDYFLRRGQIEQMVRGGYHRVFIAELDGILVGAAILTRGTHLANVLVHPAYRGLGIGRALLAASGAQTVSAKLDSSAGDPRGFYRALGFVSTGQRNSKGNIELMRLVCQGQGGDRRAGNGRTRQKAARTSLPGKTGDSDASGSADER